MPDTSFSSGGSNGHSTVDDAIYALSDEQILEIDDSSPAEDASVPAPNPAPGPRHSAEGSDVAAIERDRLSRGDGLAASQSTQHGNPVGGDRSQPQSAVSASVPPTWLAEAIADPRRGGEARAFWESAQSAERDSAAYRATFPTPEAARDAATRADQLSLIDRAYYGTQGVAPGQLSASREALAQQLLREDPAAFRNMLAAGLRAAGVINVEQVLPNDNSGTADRSAPALDRSLDSSQSHASRAAAHNDPHSRGAHSASDQAAQQARLAGYAAFERSANDEVDRAIGPEIARVLERALPASRASAGGRATQERLAGMVHSEVAMALRQDRALGEQVAQLLRGDATSGAHSGSARGPRFDSDTRAQVVRLIAQRAASLVQPSSRRVLSEWTQSTLSAHRERSSRAATDATSRIDAAPSAAAISGDRNASGRSDRSARADRTASATTSANPSATAKRADSSGSTTQRRGINYRALTDEDILDL